MDYFDVGLLTLTISVVVIYVALKFWDIVVRKEPVSGAFKTLVLFLVLWLAVMIAGVIIIVLIYVLGVLVSTVLGISPGG